MALFDDERKGFRYKVLEETCYHYDELVKFLDEQGELGWEAFHILDSNRDKDEDGRSYRIYRVVFKASYKIKS